MPIEFRCETCGKLLKTGDDNAGRPAKCPGCGDTLAVPGAPNADSPVAAVTAPHFEGGGIRAAPHRGGLILAFGILSWVTCFLFGVAAWALAAEDLHAMRAGEMDNSGESLTRAGMYLGMANVALITCGLLGAVAIGGLAIVFG